MLQGSVGTGGSGGGYGTAGNVGGAGGAGSAANTTTHNCVTVVAGASYPATVNGQIVVSWCPQ
jgi:hypothetical protein